MSDLNDRLNQKAAELADLTGKDDKEVRSIGSYALYLVIFFGGIFAASVYGINNARTNAGQGVGWFAAFLAGIALAASIWSWLGVLWELFKRRR